MHSILYIRHVHKIKNLKIYKIFLGICIINNINSRSTVEMLVNIKNADLIYYGNHLYITATKEHAQPPSLIELRHKSKSSLHALLSLACPWETNGRLHNNCYPCLLTRQSIKYHNPKQWRSFGGKEKAGKGSGNVFV